MHNVTREWKGSTDPDVFSGTATFIVGEKTCVIRLESLSDFMVIGSLLDAAYERGHELAVHTAMSKLRNMLGYM